MSEVTFRINVQGPNATDRARLSNALTRMLDRLRRRIVNSRTQHPVLLRLIDSAIAIAGRGTAIGLEARNVLSSLLAELQNYRREKVETLPRGIRRATLSRIVAETEDLINALLGGREVTLDRDIQEQNPEPGLPGYRPLSVESFNITERFTAQEGSIPSRAGRSSGYRGSRIETEPVTAAAELFSRFLLSEIRNSFSSDRARSIFGNKATENLQKALELLDAELREILQLRIVQNRKLEENKNLNFEKQFRERQEELERISRESEGSKDIRCEIALNEQGEIEAINLRGSLSRTEMLDRLRDQIERDAAQNIPRIIDAIVNLLQGCNSPEALQTTLQLIQQLFNITIKIPQDWAPAKPPVSNELRSASNLASEINQVLETQRPPSNVSPALVGGRGVISQAGAKANPLPVVPGEIKQPNSAFETSKSPGRVPIPIESIIRQVYSQIINSAQIQQSVLNAFAQGKEQALLATDSGRELVMQIAQNILRRPVSENTPQAQQAIPSHTLSLTDIVNNIIPERVPSDNSIVAPERALEQTIDNTVNNLQGLKNVSEVAAQTRRVAELIGILATSNQSSPKPALFGNINIPQIAINPTEGQAPRPTDTNERAQEIHKNLRELLSVTERNQMRLSEEVTAKIYAGLAAINLVAEQAPAPLNLSHPPQESSRTRTLKHIVEALERQAISENTHRLKRASKSVDTTETITARTAPARTTAAARTSRVRRALRSRVPKVNEMQIEPFNFLVGIVAQRVNASGHNVEQVINILRRTEYIKDLFNHIIKAIESGDHSEVSRFICELVLRANILADGADYTPEIINTALQQIVEQVGRERERDNRRRRTPAREPAAA